MDLLFELIFAQNSIFFTNVMEVVDAESINYESLTCLDNTEGTNCLDYCSFCCNQALNKHQLMSKIHLCNSDVYSAQLIKDVELHVTTIRSHIIII